MAKFRVLAGKHTEGKGADKRPRVYKAGDIVDSKSDLLRLNSPGALKFEKVDDSVRATPDSSVPAEDAVPQDFRDQPQNNLISPAPVGPVTERVKNEPLKMDKSQPKVGKDLAPLESLNVKDLQTLAVEEEIDLKGAKTKEEIIKTLKAAGL